MINRWQHVRDIAAVPRCDRFILGVCRLARCDQARERGGADQKIAAGLHVLSNLTDREELLFQNIGSPTGSAGSANANRSPNAGAALGTPALPAADPTSSCRTAEFSVVSGFSRTARQNSR